mmetsp:Transcript_16170/g.47161  ORF Transcript_16170/g.47161 Transcript_16170/m.47161 type:complete len:372 (+) Transcript_16170:425-1540(+)
MPSCVQRRYAAEAAGAHGQCLEAQGHALHVGGVAPVLGEPQVNPPVGWEDVPEAVAEERPEPDPVGHNRSAARVRWRAPLDDERVGLLAQGAGEAAYAGRHGPGAAQDLRTGPGARLAHGPDADAVRRVALQAPQDGSRPRSRCARRARCLLHGAREGRGAGGCQTRLYPEAAQRRATVARGWLPGQTDFAGAGAALHNPQAPDRQRRGRKAKLAGEEAHFDRCSVSLRMANDGPGARPPIELLLEGHITLSEKLLGWRLAGKIKQTRALLPHVHLHELCRFRQPYREVLVYAQNFLALRHQGLQVDVLHTGDAWGWRWYPRPEPFCSPTGLHNELIVGWPLQPAGTREIAETKEVRRQQVADAPEGLGIW